MKSVKHQPDSFFLYICNVVTLEALTGQGLVEPRAIVSQSYPDHGSRDLLALFADWILLHSRGKDRLSPRPMKRHILVKLVIFHTDDCSVGV